MTDEITIMKFLKLYYRVPASKSKYFRHKDLKKLIPELESIVYSDYDELNKMMSCGICLKIKDCEGMIAYYKNPFYIDVSLENYAFEQTDEFKKSSLYHRFDNYEEQNSSKEVDEYDLQIPTISNEELEMLEKWELLELKDKLNKLNKRTMGATYFQISMIKKELSSRRKEQIGERKIYQKKKNNN